jgi:hypothetical protein
MLRRGGSLGLKVTGAGRLGNGATGPGIGDTSWKYLSAALEWSAGKENGGTESEHIK